MLSTSKLRILVLSDVHLFHDKTPTEHIVNNLFKAVPDNEAMKDVDMIVISGDLFDRAVSLPNVNVWHAHRFVNHLVHVCEKYDIVLRVLEGTPSHDWMQSRMVTSVANARGNKCDVKHVSILSIEHIERFNLDVLYVPDEWGSGCRATFEEVKELLVKHNLEKVDFAVMHGCFNYQFPVNLVGKPDVHDEASYLGITKYVIVIGHYHTPSVYERIYVPGSFDRLKHNEEEAKGYLIVDLFQNGDYNVRFIENENAMLYRTFNFENVPMEKIIATLREEIGDKEKQQFIRIVCSKEDSVYKGVADLKQLFPFVTFTVSLKKDNSKKTLVSETKDIVKPKAITMDNIVTLLRERLESKHPDKATEYISILEEVVNDE